MSEGNNISLEKLNAKINGAVKGLSKRIDKNVAFGNGWIDKYNQFTTVQSRLNIDLLKSSADIMKSQEDLKKALESTTKIAERANRKAKASYTGVVLGGIIIFNLILKIHDLKKESKNMERRIKVLEKDSKCLDKEKEKK